MDPAVVVLEGPGGNVCTGTLIAPDVVLTARHCTSFVVAGATCPPPRSQEVQVEGELDPASMRVLLGDEVSSAVVAALGLAFVVPSTQILCGADIALVLLDREILSVTPFLVESVGIAEGQYVRTVLYGNDPGLKLLREHAPVVESLATEFRVAEGTCEGAGGGPAIDEATGKVVGVLASFSPSCESRHPYDVYTRTEVFYPLIEEALAASMEAGKKVSDTNRTLPTDYGGVCTAGSDCGAGVCVDEGSTEYCSRSCSALDKCPTDYKCVSTGASEPFCAVSE
jgi:hypothetical protein